MSVRARAIAIGMLGPGISGLGCLWLLLRALLISNHPQSTFRYLLFDPSHLMIAVGIVVSVIVFPVALDVAAASEEEVQIPDPMEEALAAGELPDYQPQEAEPDTRGARIFGWWAK